MDNIINWLDPTFLPDIHREDYLSPRSDIRADYAEVFHELEESCMILPLIHTLHTDRDDSVESNGPYPRRFSSFCNSISLSILFPYRFAFSEILNRLLMDPKIERKTRLRNHLTIIVIPFAIKTMARKTKTSATMTIMRAHENPKATITRANMSSITPRVIARNIVAFLRVLIKGLIIVDAVFFRR